MHKSKLAGFIIDCNTDDLTSAANFWSAALGMAPRRPPQNSDEKYIEFEDPNDHLSVEVQSVTHASRVHLDIETDDIEAEAQRLEALGAKRLEQIKTWWVMEAPTGQRFCVVSTQTSKFAEEATVWGE